MATDKEQKANNSLDDLEPLTKPRDLAWRAWQKFEKEGDEVVGYIRDVFYRPSEGDFDEQRGITLEKSDGTLVNIGIKRKPFILDKTDDLRLGDPLKMVLSELKPASTKGYSPTKIYSFMGKNLEENAGQPTVKELDEADMKKGGSGGPSEEEQKADKEFNETGDDKKEGEDIPF